MIRLEVYGVIYGLELLLDNRIYIGQSRDMKKRIRAHKSGKRAFIDQEIQKYGWQNFVCVVLEECYSQDELDEAEKRWILRLSTIFPNGFNRTFGGKIHCQYIEDVSKKMSKSRKGKKFSQQHKDNLSKANKGQIVSSKQRLIISAKNKKNLYPILEAELEKQQLTHTELAQHLELGIGTMKDRLNGNRTLDLDTAIAIKKFWGVDMPLEELFKKNDE